jgi:hypothetical protein
MVWAIQQTQIETGLPSELESRQDKEQGV